MMLYISLYGDFLLSTNSIASVLDLIFSDGSIANSSEKMSVHFLYFLQICDEASS